jgi:hypothetical protein
MERVNERNNQPHLFASDEDTVQAIYEKCPELTWPELKNSTRKQYEENFTTYLIPQFGSKKVRKLTTMEIQEYFNTLSSWPFAEVGEADPWHVSRHFEPRQGLGHARQQPAVGVKLPRKRAVKPTVLLSLTDIRRMIEGVKEPTKSMLILIVFASMRPGEAREASRSMSTRRPGGTNEWRP